MEILKFDGGKSPKNRTRLVTMVAGAFLVAMVGSTFAANITINTNNTLEYGQGLTTAAACDSSMKITPVNFYVNGPGSTGTFWVDTFTVEDTATASTSTGLGNCINKNLKLSVWDSASASSAMLTCTVTPTGYSGSLLAGGVSNCGQGVYTATQYGFTIGFPNPASAPAKKAGDVYKITIESN